jgi:hypothetical protein
MTTKMNYYTNVVPAGLESDDEYDEFGDYIENKTYNVQQKAEDFLETLRSACISNNVPEIIRALESGNININSYLNNNWTPLMQAAFYGSFDAINYLLKNGADPLLEYDCHNVVMCVCNCSVSDEITLLNCLKLLSNFDKININAIDRSGMTALMYACSHGSLKLIEYLIDHGANIEIKDYQNGETALFFAVRSNHIDTAKFILSRGAQKDATDKKGCTVERIAENKNMVEILNLLKANDDAQFEISYSEEYTYWDKVMAELEHGFTNDIQTFLETLSMEIYANQLHSNKITFKRLLSANKNNFSDMGIILSPHYKLLNIALKSFHTSNWSTYSLGLKKGEINAEDIAQTLATIVRQLHVIDASLKYLGDQSYGLDPRNGHKALSLLKSIRVMEEKIFKILDSQVRTNKVDYVASPKLKKKSIKTGIESKLFAASVVILALLRII